MQQKRDDANAARLVMEQQLIEVIASIPTGPKSALQQFQAEKLEQLTRSNVPVQSLEQQQVENAFNNLPDAEQHALEHRAAAAFQAMVSAAYDKLRQVHSQHAPSVACSLHLCRCRWWLVMGACHAVRPSVLQTVR